MRGLRGSSLTSSRGKSIQRTITRRWSSVISSMNSAPCAGVVNALDATEFLGTSQVLAHSHVEHAICRLNKRLQRLARLVLLTKDLQVVLVQSPDRRRQFFDRLQYPGVVGGIRLTKHFSGRIEAVSFQGRAGARMLEHGLQLAYLGAFDLSFGD